MSRSISSASVEAVCVDPKRAKEIWPVIKHWLRAAHDRGDLTTFAELEKSCLEGNGLIWLAWNGKTLEGAAVTELIRTDRSLYCLIQACGGGNAKNWLHLLASIEQFARDEGCDFVRIVGRRGWKRLLNNYKEKLVVLERPL